MFSDHYPWSVFSIPLLPSSQESWVTASCWLPNWVPLVTQKMTKVSAWTSLKMSPCSHFARICSLNWNWMDEYLMPLKPHSLMVLLLLEKKKSHRSNCSIGNDWSTIIYGEEFLWSLRNPLFRNSQKGHLMLTGKILWRAFFLIKGSGKESWKDLTLGCIQGRDLGYRGGNCLLQGKKKYI